eukprot:scaffold144077_cov31-Tisochrysis_lutea.AAC.5
MSSEPDPSTSTNTRHEPRYPSPSATPEMRTSSPGDGGGGDGAGGGGGGSGGFGGVCGGAGGLGDRVTRCAGTSSEMGARFCGRQVCNFVHAMRSLEPPSVRESSLNVSWHANCLNMSIAAGQSAVQTGTRPHEARSSKDRPHCLTRWVNCLTQRKPFGSSSHWPLAISS